MAFDYENLLTALKSANNGLLSKIEINGKVYELKDLLAREGVQDLNTRVAAIEALNHIASTGIYANDVAIQTAINDAIAALEKYADDAVAAEAKLRGEANAGLQQAITDEAKARADADTALGKRIDGIDAALNVIDNADGINTLKELAQWVEEHGGEASEMAKAIDDNAKAIAQEALDRAAADKGLSDRLGVVEDMLGDGENSVQDLIADALDAAKKYADDEDAKVEQAFAAADKAITDSLGDLAYKDAVAVSVPAQTISGVKATGTVSGSISVQTAEVPADRRQVACTGSYTPAGTISGACTPNGSIDVQLGYDSTAATLTTADYTPAGTISAAFSHETVEATLVKASHAPEGTVNVTVQGAEFKAITGVGTQASFQEGAFTPATLDKTDVTANYATEGIVGSVDGETLTFSAAGIAALTATKVNSFTGGSKAADSFTANELPEMADQKVEVSAAFVGTAHDCVTGVKYDKASLGDVTFTGTKAEKALVTGVEYSKANVASQTFTGSATMFGGQLNGTAATINLLGTMQPFNEVTGATFTSDDVVLAVGDIAVAAKSGEVSYS